MANGADDLKKRFGERLRRARLLRGMSLEDLAGEIGHKVSRMALSKYENGKMGPNSSVLLVLGKALNVDPDFFFRPNELELGEISFRKQAKFGKKDQARVREEALEFFERYIDIENILGIPPTTLPQFKLDARKDLGEQVETFAKELRENIWNLGSNPISNVDILLEENGIKIKEIDTEDAFNGFSGWGTSQSAKYPVVVLASHLNEDLPRKRFTALHEVAHLVLVFPSSLTEREKENLCHRFAGAFLIPRLNFVDAFGGKRSKISIPELVAIKQEWGISMGAIMKRAQELGLVSPSYYRGHCIYVRKFGWHKKEPEFSEWIGDESSNRFKRLVYRAFSRELITNAKAASLLKMTLGEFAADFDPES